MAWKGTGWGTPQDRNDLHEDFAKAAAWANQYRRPLYLGEFGVSEGADGETRARGRALLHAKRNSWLSVGHIGSFAPTLTRTTQ